MAVSAERPRSGRWAVILLSIAAIIAAAWLIHYGAYPYPVGPEQPLPFSHHIHAGVRQISCLFCHDSADRSKNAGMPEVRKCLLCHNVIITAFEPIQRLHAYFDRKQPVPWARVYDLPDYAHFNHQMHLAGGIDCGQCHGDVKNMDRIIQAMPMEMGFCIDCHRKYDAPVSCTTCHY